jgi:CheY-like chemotaxis protein
MIGESRNREPRLSNGRLVFGPRREAEKAEKELPMLTVNKERVGRRPCLVLAHAHDDYALRASGSFHRLGWDVHRTDNGAEARGLARELAPNLVILDTQLADESGWLTCDKLTREMPRLKVLLVGDQPVSQDESFASFVGATALVDRLDGFLAIVTEFAEEPAPAVN